MLGNLAPILQAHWQAAGFKELTAIQAASLTAAQSSKAHLLRSSTGSGKTLAYLLPLLDDLIQGRVDTKQVQALILCPSKELAAQVQQVLDLWTAKTNIHSLLLLGGSNVKRQQEKLKEKPQIIVGTVGRVLALSTSRKLKLQALRWLVLDEFDQLMQGDSQADLLTLLKRLPKDIRIRCASASLGEQLLGDFKQNFPNGQVLDTHQLDQHLTAGLEHAYMLVPKRERTRCLRSLLAHLKAPLLVFVSSNAALAVLHEKLSYHQLQCEILSQDQSSLERKRALEAFRMGRSQILLTTDVASRGMDFPALKWVIEYDLARDLTSYTHRSGRVGRMGQAGCILSLVTPRDLRQLKQYQRSSDKLTAYHLSKGQLLEGERTASQVQGNSKTNQSMPKQAPRQAQSKAGKKAKVRHKQRKNKGQRLKHRLDKGN